MNWIQLQDENQLAQLIAQSKESKVLIFKHSTRCSISATALDRLERAWQTNEAGKLQAYFLDLIRYRNISNKISETFGVVHQSPQVLLIDNGKCIYDSSHWDISYPDIMSNCR